MLTQPTLFKMPPTFMTPYTITGYWDTFTVGQNIIATIKMRKKIGTLKRWLFFDSNIGLFSIALHLVIALPTLR